MFVSLRSVALDTSRPHPFLEAIGRLLVRIRLFPAIALQRVRRIAPEHAILAVMVLALMLFAIVLFTSSTGTGRGGR